jgi:flagellar hook-basal body complex protein FliE
MIGSINISNAPAWFGKNIETPGRVPGEIVAGKLAAADRATQVERIDGSTAAESGAAVKPASFADALTHAVHEVDAKMQAANVEQRRVLTGETNNLHQSMIAMQEAGVAFSLMVEVRNKLVESYQELMRMQV